MNGKNVVVVGGTGLVGSRLIKLLRAGGHRAVPAALDTGVNTITGEGLAEVMAGAEVVIDVSNAPVLDGQAAREFFEHSGRNLLRAEMDAGVQHHVVLSIVGADRMPDNAYFKAKVAQERVIRDGHLPFSILRSTQFYEFLPGIADSSMADGVIRLSSGMFQPIAADDVAAALVSIASGSPLSGTVEIAGPDRQLMHQFMRRYLQAVGDPRKVERDSAARYFGGTMSIDSLVPLGEARLGNIEMETWARRLAA